MDNLNVEYPPDDPLPRFSHSFSHQPAPSTPTLSPTKKAQSYYMPTIQSQESIDEEQSGDTFSSHLNTTTIKDAGVENIDKSLRSIDITKLKNSMKLRSAYLNYDLDDDSVVDEEDDKVEEVRPRAGSSSGSSGGSTGIITSTKHGPGPGITKQDSIEIFASDNHSDSHSDTHSEGGRVVTRYNRKESDNTILTFEIFSNGDNKYCHRSMRNLYVYMLKRCQKHDVGDEDYNNSNNKNDDDNNNKNGDDNSNGSDERGKGKHASEQPNVSNPSTAPGLGFLQLRDLRRLEYLFTPQEEPALFVRRHAVVISLDPLRVVVMADRLILLVPDGADVLIQLLCNQMQSYMNDTTVNIPFEMQAYEAIFGTVIEIQKLHLSELDARIKKVSNILRKYSIVPVEVQEKVQQFKQRISEMIERARTHKHILEELLDGDEHLSLLALSLLKEKPHLYSVPLQQEILSKHEEGESLLESYLMDYNSIKSKLTLLKSQLDGAEALVSLRLDTSRNELLITNTVVSVVSCTFAVGGYVGALFGMNLNNGFEDDPTDTFWTVTLVTTVLVVISTIGTILYLKHAEILPSRFNYLSQSEIKRL